MAGIYIHIPFCKTRCVYCDFFSSTSMSKKTQYIEALCKELELRKDYLKGEEIQTVYFGGGTPSQLSADDFVRFLATLEMTGICKSRKEKKKGCHFERSEKPNEITIEANPDDITPEYLESLKNLPFNRISIGIQSFNDAELRFLNRRHNAQKAIQAIKICQDYGFSNISIDLMYGLPNQTMITWEDTLKQALSLNIQHISAYHLIYEEGTKLHGLLNQRKIVPVDEDLSVEMFSKMMDILENNGFEHYEISNFAKPGFESKHNSSYWNGTHYLGIGAAAHSFNGKVRHWNIPNLDKYIQSINQGNLSSEVEVIGEKEAYNDFILTRMRTMKGMDLNELELLHGKEKKAYCLQQAKKHIQNQTVLQENDFLRLTRKGIFISDGIMSDLFSA
ncbi:MAG: radical SAM family heme chaperone HemW [Dysgonamonadaceae bacterium]|nr:radical SAM family heme chaperone HemW [Dysgonamonadaceae bacterium]